MMVVNCNLGPRFLAISSLAEVMNLFCITIIQIDSLPHDGNIQDAVVAYTAMQNCRGEINHRAGHISMQYLDHREQSWWWWWALLSTMLSPRLHKSICGSRYFVPFFTTIFDASGRSHAIKYQETQKVKKIDLRSWYFNCPSTKEDVIILFCYNKLSYAVHWIYIS